MRKVLVVESSASSYRVACILCRREYLLSITEKDLERWHSGTDKIQDVFPYLTASERELLISGICGICFDELFPEE